MKSNKILVFLSIRQSWAQQCDAFAVMSTSSKDGTVTLAMLPNHPLTWSSLMNKRKLRRAARTASARFVAGDV